MSAEQHSSTGGWADFIKTPPSMNSTPMSQHIPLSSSLTTAPPPEILETDIKNLFSNLMENRTAGFPDTFGSPGAMSSSRPDNYNENRSVIVTNVHPDTTEDEIKAMFSIGDKDSGLYGIHMEKIKEGKVILDYFDFRSSYTAKVTLNGKMLHLQIISVDYAPLPTNIDPSHPPNNGTIAVFHLSKKTTEDHIKAAFGEYGEIRQVRMKPSKNEVIAFVDYYNIKASKKALNAKNGKYMMGNRIKVEFSAPASVRKSQTRHFPHP